MKAIREYIQDNLLALLTYNPQEPLLFTSETFLYLFIIFLGIYILLGRIQNLRILYVVAFSYYFYYKSSGWFFLLLIVSTLIDFALGKLIYKTDHPGTRKALLFASVLANLGMLAYFKYTNFFINSLNATTFFSLSEVDIFLPIGISFFTFQTMSYTIDIYRRKLTPVQSLMDFAFFVSFFPQLVAGPIVRAADFLPQINKRLLITTEDIGKAILLICSGLFKKAVISDYIGINYVDRVFDNPTLYSGFENLIATYGYAMQIYCDFSGYSDIAIGLGLLMGFKLPVNFLKPYQARSLQDFWRRWHISLSTWLRDYLYISLGGNKKGLIFTYRNLFITMLLGGLWHGSNWKFVIWGGLHGIGLATERMISHTRAYMRLKVPDLDTHITLNYLESRSVLKRLVGGLYATAGGFYWSTRNGMEPALAIFRLPISHIFTFHFVCLCWIYFRADSFQTAHLMIDQIRNMSFDFNLGEIFSAYRNVYLMIALGYLLHFIPINWQVILERGFTRAPLVLKSLVLAGIFWLVFQIRSADIQPFIYFQF
ncbi:MAG: MBOAT family O-acyltransferase [Bacteroidota bacterium]